MAIANSQVQALVTRIDKLEKQNRRFKQLAFAALILPALLLLVLLSSVAGPAQAPTHQASAPTQKEWESATPMTPAQAPTHQASAPKPASAAERISALESRVNALTKLVNSLQDTVSFQLAIRFKSGNIEWLGDKVDELRKDMDSVKSDVDSLKRDYPGDKVDKILFYDLSDDVHSLKAFRKVMCSLDWNSSVDFKLHTGIPDPCPAF